MSKDQWEGDVRHSQSMNGWSYVEGNPINLTDPSGHCIFAPPYDTAVCIGVAVVLLLNGCSSPECGPPPTLEVMQQVTPQPGVEVVQSSDPDTSLLRMAPGVEVRARVRIPEGVTGQIQWVQNGQSKREGYTFENSTYVIGDGGLDYNLDVGVPYPAADNDSMVGPTTYEGRLIDAPQAELFPNTKSYNLEEHYRTFVTWVPDNKQCPQVTLGMLEWDWFGTAINNGGPERPAWNLLSGSGQVTWKPGGPTNLSPKLEGPTLQDLAR